MQVSHVQDHVTHAVIGGKSVIDFDVQADAELMGILSTGLYSDPPLAVIREGMCNAWDAHVEAGKCDTAIEITLDRDELVIRDYGWGIPYSRIGQIYGTYGRSSKKHDGKQTGGFGLGSKSPFAYGDHFEVTSWSKDDGNMTIYNMSKSNAQVQGKPGIVPIVSVPTTETGLKVRIKLKNPNDRHRFDLLVRRIASNGNMLATLNGQPLTVLPFDRAVHDFLITKQEVLETPHSITLRYGHVIYPVDMHDKYAIEFHRIEKLLDRIPSAQGHRSRGSKEWHVIFQAPPHSVSVTPSRESLLMQDHTVATIKQLMLSFLNMAESQLERGCYELLEDRTKKVWLTSSPKVLFEEKNKIPNLGNSGGVEPIITEIDQFVARYASYSYPDFKGFDKKDQLGRIDALIESGFGSPALTQSYRDAIEAEAQGTVWFTENISAPLIKGLVEDELLHQDKLFLYARENRNRHYSSDMKLFKHTELPKLELEMYMPFLRKVVILSHNRLDFEYRAREFPIMKHWLGKLEDVFLYTVARSPKKVEAALTFFQKMGYNILDLTKAQPWEEQDAAAPVKKDYEVKPRRKGLPILTSIIDKAGEINTSWASAPDVALVEAPSFIIKLNCRAEMNSLGFHSNTTSKFILKNWGKLGGVVVNSNQEDKYLAMGIAHYEDFILEKIRDEFLTNPRIQESLPFVWKRHKNLQSPKYRWEQYKRELMASFYADKDLREYFGIVDTMTAEDRIYFTMWEELQSEGKIGTKKIGDEIVSFLNKFKPDPAIMELYEKIGRATLLEALDTTKTKNLMCSKNTPAAQKLVMRDILLAAIEG